MPANFVQNGDQIRRQGTVGAGAEQSIHTPGTVAQPTRQNEHSLVLLRVHDLHLAVLEIGDQGILLVGTVPEVHVHTFPGVMQPARANQPVAAVVPGTGQHHHGASGNLSRSSPCMQGRRKFGAGSFHQGLNGDPGLDNPAFECPGFGYVGYWIHGQGILYWITKECYLRDAVFGNDYPDSGFGVV